MKKIAIIGAGLSGVIVGNELKDYANVTIFEKSRGVGGRLATRYNDNYEFDHGVPFFYARNKDFVDFVNKLEDNGIIKRWDAQFAEFDGNKIITSRKWDKSYPHYVGVPRMTSICQYLAMDLEIKLNTKITKVTNHKDKWRLFSEEENSYDNFDWLIMAIPVQQAIEITSLHAKNMQELNNIKMKGCYALMLGFEKALELVFDAALVKNAYISWIAINSTKPARKHNFSMVVLSTNKWADANIEEEKHIVTEHMIKEASFVLGQSLYHADHIDLHKWRYANASKVQLQPFVDRDKKLAFSGDWTVKGVVEGAFLSAKNICNEIKF